MLWGKPVSVGLYLAFLKICFYLAWGTENASL